MIKQESWNVRTVSGCAGGFLGKATVDLSVNCNCDTVEEVRTLVAAAPDLLAALERLASAAGPFRDSHSPYWTIGEDDLTAARAAIAKARGE